MLGGQVDGLLARSSASADDREAGRDVDDRAGDATERRLVVDDQHRHRRRRALRSPRSVMSPCVVTAAPPPAQGASQRTGGWC